MKPWEEHPAPVLPAEEPSADLPVRGAPRRPMGAPEPEEPMPEEERKTRPFPLNTIPGDGNSPNNPDNNIIPGGKDRGIHL